MAAIQLANQQSQVKRIQLAVQASLLAAHGKGYLAT